MNARHGVDWASARERTRADLPAAVAVCNAAIQRTDNVRELAALHRLRLFVLTGRDIGGAS